ncbi:MAG: hypothetical protein M1818_004896 [Claussenomyces sp. TS43310]|nr:MAG: hypothetical protein M1818_004896 [Claussenomyces sp. TS43310]
MRFSGRLIVAFMATLAISTSARAFDDLQVLRRGSESHLPFDIKPAFTAQLAFKTLPSIPIPGGALSVEPLTGGQVTGSMINGTVISGVAHPSIYNGGAIWVPAIELYGITSDNQTFFVHDTGVGSIAGQIQRMVLPQSLLLNRVAGYLMLA